MMKVRNMVSNRSGNAVANQFVMVGDNKAVFQSYDSIICVIDYSKEGAERITLGRDWDYSRTTAKYLHQFLYEYAHMNTNAKGLRIAIQNHDIAYDENLR